MGLCYQLHEPSGLPEVTWRFEEMAALQRGWCRWAPAATVARVVIAVVAAFVVVAWEQMVMPG